MNKIETIKKGEKFICIKDFVMDCGRIDYTRGLIYLSEKDKCITDNENRIGHQMIFISSGYNVNDYFIKLDFDAPIKKRITNVRYFVMFEIYLSI